MWRVHSGTVTGDGWWLQLHFQANTHPGSAISSHERNREAVYYYYAVSVSRAFQEDEEGHLTLRAFRNWSAAQTKRQHSDGSWANPVDLVRQNDPIVATNNALTALAASTPAK